MTTLVVAVVAALSVAVYLACSVHTIRGDFAALANARPEHQAGARLFRRGRHRLRRPRVVLAERPGARQYGVDGLMASFR